MPTPILTCACEYASGSISKPTSANNLRYFMVNLLLSVPVLASAEVAGSRGPSVFFI
jgi:hypothetical protein